jgi:flagella synthesis protein FlgN
MDAWLTQHGQSEHRTRWQQLCGMEREAQAMNQRIGALIDMRLSATRQALNVLVHAATNQGGLYDQAGQAVAAHKGKPLTAA